MGYALRAKCDVCGQKAGLWYIKKYDKIVCQDCYDEYCKLQQQHETEIEDFFKGEKRQEG